MFLPSPLDPGLLYCTAVLFILVALAWGVGSILIPRSLIADDWLSRVAMQLSAGLIFLAGVSSILCLKRLSYVSLMPMLQIAFTIWAHRKGLTQVSSSLETPSLVQRARSLTILAIVCIAFEWWNSGWLMPDGSMRVPNYDLGHYAQMVSGLLESRVADGWSAALGAHARESAFAADYWYHWSPLWLASAVTSITGMMPLASLLHVVATAMDFALVLLAGALVRRLARTSFGISLIAGSASLIAVQLMRDLGKQWCGIAPENDTLHLSRQSLAYAFAYKFEGIILLTTLLAWLRGQRPLAGILLAIAAVSSPHAVAVGGVTAGMFGIAGVALRRPLYWRTAASMIGILLGVWMLLRFGLRADLPKGYSEAVHVFSVTAMFKAALHGLKDAGQALLLGLVSLPGILHLAFARDERATDETRAIGWLPLSALVGSFIGFRLLGEMADNLHFVLMSQAVLVMPAGIWGLVRWMSVSSQRTLQATLAMVLLLGVGMGAMDLRAWRKEFGQTPWTRSDLEPLKLALKGRSFGYFAKIDRTWWLPWHSSLAAVLDVRCMRLQSFPGEFNASNITLARPYEVLPALDGESGDAWSLRFAKHAGFTCVAEIGNDTLPAPIKASAKEIAKAPLITLYELR